MDPISAIASGIGSIFGVLPALGVGSKSRKKEQQASVEAAKDIDQISARAKARQMQNIIVIVFAIVAISAIGFIVFKNIKK